jgi:hypothetical protein
MTPQRYAMLEALIEGKATGILQQMKLMMKDRYTTRFVAVKGHFPGVARKYRRFMQHLTKATESCKLYCNAVEKEIGAGK